jgi:hypothetical protein
VLPAHSNERTPRGNRRHSFLLIIAGYFVRAAAIFVPGPRNVRRRTGTQTLIQLENYY